MDNSTRNIQVQSFGNYLKDMWIVAIILVLIHNQTTIGLPIIWIGLQIVIAVSALLIFRKTGPNIAIPFIIPFFILLILFFFGSPIWLFVIGTVISIWRIQARFNMMQHELHVDSFFMIVFFLTFLGIHFLCFLIRIEEYHEILYSLFASGSGLFVGLRLFSIWMSVDKHITVTRTKLLSIYVMIIGSVASLSLFIYFVAVRIIRDTLEVLIVAITSVLIIPFAPFIEYLDKLAKKLDFRRLDEGEQVSLGEPQAILPKDVVEVGNSEGFPFGWVFLVLAVIILLIAIRYLIKNKPEKLEVEQQKIQYNHTQIQEEETHKTNSHSLYKMDTSFLREKYVQFETEAQIFELGRDKSETIREWFKRMDWTAEAEFFIIYEEVRYGEQLIESQKAELFIETIDEIKNKYFFKKDV